MQADHLSATFAALADPTRRAILLRLSSGEASVTELAEPFAMSMPAISKHLKVLERAGLIARGREAQWRPCRLEPGPLKGVAEWVEHYRRFWEHSFDRLDHYLREWKTQEIRVQNNSAKEKRHGRKKRKRSRSYRRRGPGNRDHARV
jgi:DNA-binding transcriptional ArsR family regulator